MLQFNQDWKFHSPGSIETEVDQAFHDMIVRSARGQQKILEHFKKYFAYASGTTPSESSDASWADTDLQYYMSECSDNAPFLLRHFMMPAMTLKRTIPISQLQILSI